MPQTRNNLVTLERETCFMCDGPIIDGYCACLVGQDVAPAPWEPAVLKINSEEYRVESFTHPGNYYGIERNEYGEWRCGCPAFRWERSCKHIRVLLDHLGTPVVAATVAPKPQPTPAPEPVVVGRSTELDLSADPLVRMFDGQPITKSMRRAERAYEKRSA